MSDGWSNLTTGVRYRSNLPTSISSAIRYHTPVLARCWMRGCPSARLEQLPKRNEDPKKNDDAPRGGTDAPRGGTGAANEQLRPAEADGGGQLAEMLIKVFPIPVAVNASIRAHSMRAHSCHAVLLADASRCDSCLRDRAMQASFGAAKKHWVLR